MGYLVQYFRYFQGYWKFRKINYGDICQFIRDICLFTSRDMGYLVPPPIQASSILSSRSCHFVKNTFKAPNFLMQMFFGSAMCKTWIGKETRLHFFLLFIYFPFLLFIYFLPVSSCYLFTSRFFFLFFLLPVSSFYFLTSRFLFYLFTSRFFFLFIYFRFFFLFIHFPFLLFIYLQFVNREPGDNSKGLTHLSRLGFPTIIKWASLFPFQRLLSGIFHFYSILIEHVSKQRRPWSDAAFCGVWSGSALFCLCLTKRTLGLYELSTSWIPCTCTGPYTVYYM